MVLRLFRFRLRLNGMVEGPASRIQLAKKRTYQNWTVESRNSR
jgi:hypothetical protein